MQVGVLLVCVCGVEWTGAPEDECNNIRNMLSNKKLS